MSTRPLFPILRFALFILWLIAFPMNGFLLGTASLEHPLLYFVIPDAIALFAVRYLVTSRFFPVIANTSIVIIIAATALFPFSGTWKLPLFIIMGIAGAGFLTKTIGDMNLLKNPPLAGAMSMAGGNLALLILMELPLEPSAMHILLAALLFVPLFSPTPCCVQMDMARFAWYLPFLFVYNLVSGLMYGALMDVYARQAYVNGIEVIFYVGAAFAGAWLVRKGKDLLLVLGILGGMLSFSIFNIKGAFAVNLSMFAFQGAAGFVDIFILVLLLSRADCMMVAGPVFGTVCLGIAGGYVMSGITGGVASSVVGAANLFLTIAVFIFVFLAKKWQSGGEEQAVPAELPLTQAISIISLPPTLQKRLSDREMAVLDCVLNRKTFRETAKTLSLSESSVKTYMKRIYEKAGVTGKNELFSVLADSEGDSAKAKES
ncbi:MAG: helix-turn-helix transcriptional regulator [Proteobacteria bacterium]|nr:helix-turn-helix transcriptional regulator [Pseudomonadota bacterium]